MIGEMSMYIFILILVMAVFFCMQYFAWAAFIKRNNKDLFGKLESLENDLRKTFDERQAELKKELRDIIECSKIISSDVKTMSLTLDMKFKNLVEANENKFDKIEKNIGESMDKLQDLVGDKLQKKLDEINKNIGEKLEKIQEIVGDKLDTKLDFKIKSFLDTVTRDLKTNKDNFDSQFKQLNDTVRDKLKDFSTSSDKKFDDINKTLEDKLATMQNSNEKKLNEMKDIVDTKLQETLEKRISESFKLVNTQLSQVHEGLGEMKNLASDVGNLKKVLSNVKTRGMWGEIQLGSILEQILAPEQYETNFEVKKGSGKRVEYVVKIPSNDSNKNIIYLPIDSKFPLDTYINLQDAYDCGDKNSMDKAKKDFISAIKSFAKDISTKYIDSVRTTDFAIMFLPSEGLYSEVVSTNGLLEELQNNHRINIAGPSTMAALLNSLYMSFRAFAIEKRSSEVWKILGAVKTEFNKFGEVIEKAQRKLGQASDDLDLLIGTRTRQIKSKLKSVEEISIDEAEKILPRKDLELYNAEDDEDN